MPFRASLKRSCRGASSTESGLLVGLVAVVAIGAVAATGGKVSQLVCSAGNALSAGSCIISPEAGSPASGETPDNQPPLAGAVTISGDLYIGQTRSVAPGELLINSIDPDGDSLSIAAVSGPSSGTVELTGSFVHFTPEADGPQSFIFTVEDGNDGQDSASASIEVFPANSPPIAGNVSLPGFGYPDPGSQTYAESALLANSSDPDGDPLYIVSVSNEINGTAILNGTSVEFVASAAGPASFDFAVTDGVNAPAAATAGFEAVTSGRSCGPFMTHKAGTNRAKRLAIGPFTDEDSCRTYCLSFENADACFIRNSSSCEPYIWNNDTLTSYPSKDFRLAFCS